mmetsp:Transcript_29882/g.69073  ORF Transcript_29882/g.69073 Transcript_29882/m.69073 type:complete len:227 (-) Transcript_29882:433-1113(-)
MDGLLPQGSAHWNPGPAAFAVPASPEKSFRVARRVQAVAVGQRQECPALPLPPRTPRLWRTERGSDHHCGQRHPALLHALWAQCRVASGWRGLSGLRGRPHSCRPAVGAEGVRSCLRGQGLGRGNACVWQPERHPHAPAAQRPPELPGHCLPLQCGPPGCRNLARARPLHSLLRLDRPGHCDLPLEGSVHRRHRGPPPRSWPKHVGQSLHARVCIAFPRGHGRHHR